MMKGGSCATERCEPCQVGNQAALSGCFGVPQGSLPGAGSMVSGVEVVFDLTGYGLIRHTVSMNAGVRSGPPAVQARFLLSGEGWYVSRVIQKVAAAHV